MEVYLDILLAENLIINLFLLLITFKVLRYKYSRVKIYLASFIGSLYTISIFYDNKFLNSFLANILVVFFMIAVSMKNKNFKNIIKAIFIFYILSFMLAGVCFTLITMQNTYEIGDYFIIKNNSIKWVILSLLFFSIIIIRITDVLKERAIINNFLFDICIREKSNTLVLKGFLDTGNELREPVSNLPCIIVEENYLKDIDLKKEDEFIINYKTISDQGKLIGFKAEEIKIKNSHSDKWENVDAVVCITSEKLSRENEYNALLSRGII